MGALARTLSVNLCLRDPVMRLVLLLVLLCCGPAATAATTRQQQSKIAKWTAENICAMGVDRFYAMPEAEIRTLFEQQTGMRYEDIPLAPTEAERARITGQLSAYLSSVCPKELEKYQGR